MQGPTASRQPEAKGFHSPAHMNGATSAGAADLRWSCQIQMVKDGEKKRGEEEAGFFFSRPPVLTSLLPPHHLFSSDPSGTAQHAISFRTGMPKKHGNYGGETEQTELRRRSAERPEGCVGVGVGGLLLGEAGPTSQA